MPPYGGSFFIDKGLDICYDKNIDKFQNWRYVECVVLLLKAEPLKCPIYVDNQHFVFHVTRVLKLTISVFENTISRTFCSMAFASSSLVLIEYTPIAVRMT